MVLGWARRQRRSSGAAGPMSGRASRLPVPSIPPSARLRASTSSQGRGTAAVCNSPERDPMASASARAAKQHLPVGRSGFVCTARVRAGPPARRSRRRTRRAVPRRLAVPHRVRSLPWRRRVVVGRRDNQANRFTYCRRSDLRPRIHGRAHPWQGQPLDAEERQRHPDRTRTEQPARHETARYHEHDRLAGPAAIPPRLDLDDHGWPLRIQWPAHLPTSDAVPPEPETCSDGPTGRLASRALPRTYGVDRWRMLDPALDVAPGMDELGRAPREPAP
jgi:hypothetical protein